MRTLDPRTRLVSVLLLFAVPLSWQSPLWLLPPVALLMGALIRCGGGRVLRGFSPLLAMICLASLLLWPAFVAGKTHVLVYLTREGLIFGAGMGLRLTACACLGALYLLTSPVEETAWALNRLGMPYAVSFGVVMAFRLMEQIGNTARTVVAAQRSRGLTLQTSSLLRRWKSYVPLLVPILVLSMRRVDGIAMAMESRAFKPTGRRTSLMRFDMRSRDWAVLVGSTAAVAAAVWLRLHGYSVLIAGRL